ncbi:hypothetical protein Tco_1038722 [Tanacetum coccineum]
MNAKESWELIEDLALYDNESGNDPRDFAKRFKAISLPQDVPSTSDCRLIELENQVQRLIKAHLAPKSSNQVNKIASSYEIYSGFTFINPNYLNYSHALKSSVPYRVLCSDWKLHGLRERQEAEKRREESDEETKEETEEEEEDDPEYFDIPPTIEELSYHEWLLKNPRPPWVNAKIKTGNLDNIKISCMVGQFLKRQAYIDPESPINVMSRLNYYWIMSEGLKLRRKLSNHKKISNFVGRVKRLKVFVGNFTYECDFVMLEDTTSVIDHYLGGMVFGKPFVKETGLVYNKDEGTVTFEKDEEKITFKMPHKMERFKHIDKDILKTNNIPPFIITRNDDDQEKTHYSYSLNIGPIYRRDESMTEAIQCLIKMKSKVIFDEKKPGSS